MSIRVRHPRRSLWIASLLPLRKQNGTDGEIRHRSIDLRCCMRWTLLSPTAQVMGVPEGRSGKQQIEETKKLVAEVRSGAGAEGSELHAETGRPDT